MPPSTPIQGNTGQFDRAEEHLKRPPKNDSGEKSEMTALTGRLGQRVLPWKTKRAPAGSGSGLPALLVSKINALTREIKNLCTPGRKADSHDFLNSAELTDSIITTSQGNRLKAAQVPGLLDFLPELHHVLEQKQGVIYLGSRQARNQAILLRDHLKAVDGLDLDPEGKNRLIGIYQAAPPNEHYGELWMMQIHDRHLGLSIDVPLTLLTLDNLDTDRSLNESDAFVEQLAYVQENTDRHLMKIHQIYQDSPTQPAILCPENPRYSQMVCAIEEVRAQQMRRQVPGSDRSELFYAVTQTFNRIADSQRGYQGEEGSLVEAYVSERMVDDDLPGQVIPFSVGGLHETEQQNLPKDLTVWPKYIRAFKRHIQSDKPTIEPANTTPMSPSPQAESVQQTQSIESSLSLDGKQPESQRENRLGSYAYKEASKQMQCGVQAINGYFQGPVLSAGALVPQMIADRLNFLEAIDTPPEGLCGLAHPLVLQSLKEGKPATISKTDFLGTEPNTLGVLSEQSPQSEWQQLINLQNPGKDWVDDKRELDRIDHITVTPEHWLSCQRGLDVEEITRLTNQLLKDKPAQWSHLPEQVEKIEIDDGENTPKKLGFLLESWLQKHPQADLPVMVLQGRQGSGNHFYTIVPDAHGNWLSLNSDGTERDGLQECSLWAEKGQLGVKLSQVGAGALIYGIPNN